MRTLGPLLFIRFTERTTKKHRKLFDSGGRAMPVFSNCGVRKGVSFWNEIGVRSRGVRLMFGGRTRVFEKEETLSLVTNQQLAAGRGWSRCNSLTRRDVTSNRAPAKKSLTSLRRPASGSDQLRHLAAELVNPSNRKKTRRGLKRFFAAETATEPFSRPRFVRPTWCRPCPGQRSRD